MSELPTVRPEPPAAPQPAGGTRPALTALDLLVFLAGLFAFVSLAIWGFLAWPFPWSLVAGIGAPLLALLVWGLFVSPRAVVPVHPFARALVELMIYAAATIAWWTAGQAWIGLAYGIFAVTVGVLAGRRRLAE